MCSIMYRNKLSIEMSHLNETFQRNIWNFCAWNDEQYTNNPHYGLFSIT